MLKLRVEKKKKDTKKSKKDAKTTRENDKTMDLRVVEPKKTIENHENQL